jgi:hypothetical protein
MNTNWKSLSLAAVGAIGLFSFAAAPAHAQGFSFGYSGPGVSVGVNTGVPAYYGGGLYGGGYYGGYPVVAPRPLVAGPVVGPVIVRRPAIVPGPWIGPRAYVVGRPYGRYGPGRRYYWR